LNGEGPSARSLAGGPTVEAPEKVQTEARTGPIQGRS